MSAWGPCPIWELRTNHIPLAGQYNRSPAQVLHNMNLAYCVHGAHNRRRVGASHHALEGERAARRRPPLPG
jgi:hypothetical protein